MTPSELRGRRVRADEEFLRVTDAHLKIAGNRSAAITYAAIEWRARLNGPGDTEPLEISVAEIIRSQGVLAQADSTVRLALSQLVESGVLLRHSSGRDNRYVIQLNWPGITNRLYGAEMNAPAEMSEPGPPISANRSADFSEPPPPISANPPIRTYVRTEEEPTHPESEREEVKKERERGGWEPNALEVSIKELLVRFGQAIPGGWSNKTVTRLAEAVEGNPRTGLRNLEADLRAIAWHGAPPPRSIGAIVARARGWMLAPEVDSGPSLPAMEEFPLDWSILDSPRKPMDQAEIEKAALTAAAL